MKPGAPTLYVGVDGPVLIDGRDRDPFLNASVAAYAKPFLHWAVSNTRVRWLSSRPFPQVAYLATLLGLPADAVAMVGHHGSRTGAIDARGPFAWVESWVTPAEHEWMGRHPRGRLLVADPTVGVTLELARDLAAALGLRPPGRPRPP